MWSLFRRDTRQSKTARRTPPTIRPRLEVLEDRCLMSAGVVGDSISVGEHGVTGHNWVDALVDLRGLDFGGQGHANVSYAPNTYGALAASAPDLAQKISAGQVNLAAVELGAHDFIWHPNPQGPFPYEDESNLGNSVLGDIFDGALSGTQLQTYTNQVITNLGQVFDTLSAAGNASLVAFNIPDFSITPALAALVAANPTGAQAYTAAITAADSQYEPLANQRGLPLIDLLGFGHLVTSGNPMVVGGVTLDLHDYSNPANPYDFFADSQHPGTVASGLIANMFIEAVDNSYGANIAPLSDQEILQYAGITPPPSPTPTYFDVSRFVIYPTPTLTGLSANTAPEGHSTLALTVNATNFLSDSVVQWNGTPLATTFVSSTQLTATLPAAELAEEGTANVFVVNPTPGGGASNGVTFTIPDAPLDALGAAVAPTAGTPFNGVLASFTDANSAAVIGDYTASINWGDRSNSLGTISANGNGGFSVIGGHTYAASNSYTVSVTINDIGGSTATANSTANVASLGRAVREEVSGIGFWHNKHGQALLDSFNGGSSSTALADWLVSTFPNLYGANANANNLTGKTNAQVAAFDLTLFGEHGPKLDAQVLATALNVYATTLSLGGTAGQSYGFLVDAYGLGARSSNVGDNGSAFGVPNNTSLNVYQILLAANQRASNGVLYNGDATLDREANNVFSGINQAGGI